MFQQVMLSMSDGYIPHPLNWPHVVLIGYSLILCFFQNLNDIANWSDKCALSLACSKYVFGASSLYSLIILVLL